MNQQKKTVKSALPEKISGETLVLKSHELALATQMFQAVDRDRSRLREHLPWVDLTVELGDEVSYVQMTQEKRKSHELFDYGMFRKSDLAYMGNIGVHSISWDQCRCEIGYWILSEFEGHGYVTEAVRLLETAIFSAGFNRIEIRCSSSNPRSAQVPLRCGFRLEGTLRQDQIENGEFRDTLIFGKLRSDLTSR